MVKEGCEQMGNSHKKIVSLCSGTGAWEKPYFDNGYDVYSVTLPDNDVRDYIPPRNVYGILAAPPCTHFSVSGAQYWKQKDIDGRTLEGMAVVIACLKIIAMCRPTFWALENPVGRLSRWMGPPQLKFDPCDYGDPWTKKTLLWGVFNLLEKDPIEPMSNKDQLNPISQPMNGPKKIGWHTEEAKILRAITPPGFAKAFFRANR
jgi:hypothetical protein